MNEMSVRYVSEAVIDLKKFPRYGKEKTMNDYIETITLGTLMDSYHKPLGYSGVPKKQYSHVENEYGLVVQIPKNSNTRKERGRHFFVALKDGRSGRAYDYTRDDKLNDPNDPLVMAAWDAFGEPKPRVKDVIREGHAFRIACEEGQTFYGLVTYKGDNNFKIVHVNRGYWTRAEYTMVDYSAVTKVVPLMEAESECF